MDDLENTPCTTGPNSNERKPITLEDLKKVKEIIENAPYTTGKTDLYKKGKTLCVQALAKYLGSIPTDEQINKLRVGYSRFQTWGFYYNDIFLGELTYHYNELSTLVTFTESMELQSNLD